MADGLNEYRVVVVGAGGVGKSALTVRFIQGNFVEKYDPTIEDSYIKQIELDGKACILDIMDTAGQEEYSSLRDQYMKTGEGFVMVYSIVSRLSFESLGKLRMQILRLKEEYGEDVPMVLAGNKSDLEEDREVTTEEGKSLAEDFHCSFLECSAKSDINVSEVFNELVHVIDSWRVRNPQSNGRNHGKKKGRCVLF